MSDVRGLHEEFARRGVSLMTALQRRPWGTLDFSVEDPDGYVLCFSENVQP